MRVTLFNTQKKLPISSFSVKKMVLFLLQAMGVPDFHEVIVHLVGKKRISELHRDFFDDPTSTDCISFPLDSPFSKTPGIIGEIFICPEVALEYAQKKGENPYREVALYITHALLHLMGYDDLQSKEKQRMRRKEKHYLTLLQKEDLFPKEKGLYKTSFTD